MQYIFKGLTLQEVEESRQKHGANELPPVYIESFWRKLWSNFKDPIIIILCVALLLILGLSFLNLTKWYEAVAIGFAVLLATLVATFSEYKNESSFQKLQEEALQTFSNVFREGKILQIPIHEVVAGDYILLQAGEKVPADGILIKGSVNVNQASLTGESENVSKIATEEDSLFNEEDLLGKYQLFRGAMVDEGEGVMKVRHVGTQSFYGKLAQELSVSNGRLSPLQVKLVGLADTISKFGYIGACLIALSFMFQKAVIAQGFDTERMGLYFSDWQLVIRSVQRNYLTKNFRV